MVRGGDGVGRKERWEDLQGDDEAGKAGLPVPALLLGSRETLQESLASLDHPPYGETRALGLVGKVSPRSGQISGLCLIPFHVARCRCYDYSVFTPHYSLRKVPLK